MERALIVDDHPSIRMALRITLEKQGVDEIDECSNGIDAIRSIKGSNYQIVVLDIGIPGMDGMSVMHAVRKAENQTRILVFTSQPLEIYASRCMKAGASGFVSKNDQMENMSAAIKAVISGYTFFPNISFDASVKTSQVEILSNRELDVFRKLAGGMSNNDIAEQMCLSNKTISTYKSRIMEKLGAGTLVELLNIARQEDI